ncbi:MAG: bifunctional phosphoribosyl-AMP cyclohydrolase/phosphoribosyl-ATP diphosphatase HisIE [Blastocatellia bacterium]|nr:bifunctional phosphoribosyl-AMP cyclohydrolase/phosphoribosyl-ATP diphosphatase HisIE [Blastocatellia bacterium]MCX7752451.1 bifunctional phosphoribosyl-AMP cyclohydrolase/phosphoribosyl-ATP diphosphatase HisIE [Blastocatellia bacterium]MDW8167434.1 bifunctional phosphoribosyl-AMP cyclohydrolase/phosphoribosyl-ATP diphosphatase HisIE [Acidobacteriota bacterium]
MVIQGLRFDERGLIPVIIQDHETGRILMLAHMNAEALALTLRTGETHTWSAHARRVRREVGAEGNTQRVVDIIVDCDGDALIVKVDPRGPACHTGEETCFSRALTELEEKREGVSVVGLASMEMGILLGELFEFIQERNRERPENSYTALLLSSGVDAILRRLGEQLVDVTIAAKAGSKKELSGKIADLFYHLLVLIADRELNPRDILFELRSRTGRASESRVLPSR